LLILLAVIAVAVAVPASIAGAAAPDAQTAAKAKKKTGKKKAAKCKTAKKKGKAKGKAKGKGKARKSLAADAAAKGKSKAKGKGKKKGKKKCGKAKAKGKSKGKSPQRYRSPLDKMILEQFKARPKPPAPKPVPTIKDMVPADGTYTAASAPGLTVTISGDSKNARVVYTVPTAEFEPLCQAHVTGDGVVVDLSGPLIPSQSTKRGSLQLHESQSINHPTIPAHNTWSVSGSIGKDGSFTLNVGASFPYPPDLWATCSGTSHLTSTLAK
jgi:hypothetical protein